MKYALNEPTIRGRASIFNTDVDISFYCSSQVNDLLPYLMAEGFDFEITHHRGDSLTPDSIILTVKEICWARNVTHLFKELEKYDYNAGQEDDNE